MKLDGYKSENNIEKNVVRQFRICKTRKHKMETIKDEFIENIQLQAVVLGKGMSGFRSN
jgi:hypothetical protein